MMDEWAEYEEQQRRIKAREKSIAEAVLNNLNDSSCAELRTKIRELARKESYECIRESFAGCSLFEDMIEQQTRDRVNKRISDMKCSIYVDDDNYVFKCKKCGAPCHLDADNNVILSKYCYECGAKFENSPAMFR